MSLTDEARAMQRKPGMSCAIQRTKNQNPALHAEIVEALNSDVDCSSIARALASRQDLPVEISRDMLERHRRGDCRRCQT